MVNKYGRKGFAYRAKTSPANLVAETVGKAAGGRPLAENELKAKILESTPTVSRFIDWYMEYMTLPYTSIKADFEYRRDYYRALNELDVDEYESIQIATGVPKNRIATMLKRVQTYLEMLEMLEANVIET